MNILLIDDEDRVFDRLKRTFKDQDDIIITHCKNFHHFERYLSLYKIDIMILDLNNDGGITGETETGSKIYNTVYEKYFLPLIIYSGYSDNYDNPHEDNIFIKKIQKGSSDIKQLKSAINEFKLFVEKKISITSSINKNISNVFRDTYQKFSKAKSTDIGSRTDLFTNLMRRRLAASFDYGLDTGSIKAWEIYLYPPLDSNNLLMGDIIRKKGEDKNNPASYKIILSPSCDLQQGQDPVEKVIVATFKQIREAYNKKDKIKQGILSTSSPNRFMIFHELFGEFPHMACDLKSLEIINFNKIGQEADKEFEKVVSIDSPFRESLSWAFLHINGRPGLPNRDFKSWEEDIKKKCFIEPEPSQ
ncbi:response regulator [Treponema primitia]|uniref:response regulator n=1 Tax=Treponema primitia TaxID=88058 RepID=UPI0002554F74|nr:response regulator [Treponema primitia]